MRLRFCGSSADGCPGDEVGDVLGCDRVKKFGGCRNTKVDDIPQKIARDTKALVDIRGLVEIGIHDKPFPS